MSVWPIEIGSQLFINKYDSTEKIRNWVIQMHESGLRIIRLFMLWDHLEPKKDIWYFEQYDTCFKQAEALEMKIVPTLMAEAAPGWMKMTERAQSCADLNDMEFWNTALDYVTKVVGRYCKSPALHSWILMNEPARGFDHGKNNLLDFKSFLKKIYNNDIDNLNKVYFKQYQSFDEATDPATFEKISPLAYTESLDWNRFAVDNLMGKLTEIKDRVRQIDNEHMVHVNPQGLAWVNYGMFSTGQSVWEEAKIVDFLGCSCHPSWHANRFPVKRFPDFIAFSAEIMKSATPHKDGLFWISELQGGTTIFTAFRYFCPTGDDIKHWMWEGIGSGAKGIVFWCFNTRYDGYEGSEWGLLNQAGKPSKRLNAVSEVAGLIEKNKILFSKTRPPKPDVWILYSESSCAMGWHEGSVLGSITYDGGIKEHAENPRNVHMGVDAVFGAYLMIKDLGVEVGFIDEERFIKQGLESGSVLIVSQAVALSMETCEAIERYVSSGGYLIADGLCGMKDVNGCISEGNKTILDKVFGAELLDIEAVCDEVDNTLPKDSTLDEWFVRCSFDEAANVEKVCSYSNTETAVIKHKYGKGTALRIGTVFFQRYMTRACDSRLQLLKTWLPPMESKKSVLLNINHQLRLKVLEIDSGEILIILNRAECCKAVISFTVPGKLYALDADEVYDFNAGGKLEITVGDREVRIFKALYEILR